MDTIISILQGCQDKAQQLLNILWKILAAAGDGKVKRLWKAVDGITREKKILEHLRKLEQEKTSLALCIATIDSWVCHLPTFEIIQILLISIKTTITYRPSRSCKNCLQSEMPLAMWPRLLAHFQESQMILPISISCSRTLLGTLQQSTMDFQASS